MLSGLVAAGNYRALVAARNNRAGHDKHSCSSVTLLALFAAGLFLLLFFYYTQATDYTP
jgi:hypothetical protein